MPRRRWQLAITLSGDDTPIGSAGIRRKGHDLHGQPVNHQADRNFEADIGYELHADHWGHSYATDAARALVALGFDELGLQRISA